MFGIEGPSHETLGLLLAWVALIVSWVFVQVVFAFYYAHEFYGPERSIQQHPIRVPR